MSRIKKLAENLKRILGEFSAVAEQDLVIAEMKIGGKVEVKDADGNIAAVEDGEYKVGEDVIEVKDGMIVSINGKTEPKQEEVIMEDAVPADEKKDEKKDEAPVDETEKLKEKVDVLEVAVTSMQEMIAAIQKSLSENFNKEIENQDAFSKQLEELNETIKMLAKMPAEFSKTNPAIQVKDSREEKLMAVAKLFAKR